MKNIGEALGQWVLFEEDGPVLSFEHMMRIWAHLLLFLQLTDPIKDRDLQTKVKATYRLILNRIPPQVVLALAREVRNLLARMFEIGRKLAVGGTEEQVMLGLMSRGFISAEVGRELLELWEADKKGVIGDLPIAPLAKTVGDFSELSATVREWKVT